MLTQAQISKLLNRPLTTAEVTNFDSYLKIATERLESLLCTKLSITAANQTYLIREGYRTLYTDIFNGTPTVTIDGVVAEADSFSPRQFDNLNGDWYNSIVFKKFLSRDVQEVTVAADFGFDPVPEDFQLLLARMFALNTSEQTGDDRVRSKKIEDFSVTLNDQTAYQQLVASNANVIRRYSTCQSGEVTHGSVSYFI